MKRQIMTMGGKSIRLIAFMIFILFVLTFGIREGKAQSLTAHARYPREEWIGNVEPGHLRVLTPADISRLAHATVRITGVREGAKREYAVLSGSGTILTPDGIILTNCHVANPEAMGYEKEMWIDGLVVSMLVAEDAPPVPTYHAERLAYDAKLDLAVIKITETLDGKAVVTAKLNLPNVRLGDSDIVGLGDNLNVFGYPTIGGETITYTTGVISGFDSEEPIGNRAWIKTAAMIAGGNSGGLAANDKGEIIGVPTRGGTASAEKITDCRRVEDTNDDGAIDDEDTCVPFGGFINGIRPIKWALPMIEAVKMGEDYQSPFSKKNAPDEGPEQTNKKKYTSLGWAADEPNECDFDSQERFDSGVDQIFAVFKPNDAMKEGDEVKSIWFIDDERVLTDRAKFTSRDCIWYALTARDDEDLPDGVYRLELYFQKILLADAETKIGAESTIKSHTAGVVLEGTIKNAETGKPVSGINVIALKPGRDMSAWMDDSSEKDIFSQAVSDRNGNYRLPDKMERGLTYPIIFGSAKDNYRVRYGNLTIPPDAGAGVRLDIEVTEIH